MPHFKATDVVVYLMSNEGKRLPIPVTFASRLSLVLRKFVYCIWIRSYEENVLFHEMLNSELESFFPVDCSTKTLTTIIKFCKAKIALDRKLHCKGIHASLFQQKDYWLQVLGLESDDVVNVYEVARSLQISSLMEVLRFMSAPPCPDLSSSDLLLDFEIVRQRYERA